ncbi:MAG: SUMF1/EgtB/PvdO family nonheme iron enzyme [Planctomycetaceae bacterium]|nr:SUMF1/EgtB/PvdO family nonheme iron enzyme [Planctomycetaceae bacterium]
MPDHEDSLGGETFDGVGKADRFQQSLGDGATMGGDTDGHSLGDQSTFGDAYVEDELFDDGMKLEDLSERYTEEGVLGKGGMGEVILATDTRLNRKVAIKRIIGKAARSKTAVQRFLTEAQSMAELSHPNIVQIYDYGHSTDGPFLIMECVQGGSLLDKCKVGPIDPDEAVNIFGQLCDGLAKAHASGIIHRDIKPANILMTEDGVPKLTDFGLAKDDTANTGMTMEGAVLGTLDFMPPEQRRAAKLTDHRSDLWSMAATLYQMLTGKSPKIIRFSDVPTRLQEALGKGLEESMVDRFQSAVEMKEAVQQAASAGLNTSRDLGEGECPLCGTPNPPDRKFCRNADCAVSLEVDCLRCKTVMAMWEGVCDSCGAQQDSLIEKAKVVLQRNHDDAEGFLNELMFDDALKAANVIGLQNDLRLQQFAAWHEEFLARLESTRTSEHDRLGELLREALVHEQACDYDAGLQTLAKIAESLMQTTVSGGEGTAEQLIEQLTIKQSRLKELEGIVRERVIKQEITGLLPIVNELLFLNPIRPAIQDLREQLEKRDSDLLQERDAAFNKATQQLEGQQYAEALATLDTVAAEVSNEQLENLKAKASHLLSEFNSLRDKIAAAVKGNQLKDLLPDVQGCLALKADQEDLVKLKQDLIDHEVQMEVRNQNIVSAAQRLVKQLQYDEAVELLGSIAKEYQTSTTTELRQLATKMLALRQDVLSTVSVDLSKKKYKTTIRNISNYLSEVAKFDIRDPEFQQMLDEIKVKASARARKKNVVFILILASGVVAILITGVVIKVNHDTKAVETAIRNRDWETVLQLDPYNPEGLRMREAAVQEAVAKSAVAERAEKISSALAKGDWKTVLDLNPSNSEGLRLKLAAEKVAREQVAREPTAKGQAAREQAAREQAAREQAAMMADTENTTIPSADLITNALGMSFNEIPAGTFMMGSSSDEIGRGDDETQHKVTIVKSFSIQTTEVTQGQWKALMGTEPWKGKSYVKEGPNYAATYVGWSEAVAFCNKLSLKVDKTYRLPTEAEWEYACRAGTETRWIFGDDEKIVGEYAWYDVNAWDIDEMYAHQVGLKNSNAFGLYDMHGNVYEWCQDVYERDYYKQSPEQDPRGPSRGTERVLRGGSWLDNASDSRSACRNKGVADNRNLYFAGFRLVRELD